MKARLDIEFEGKVFFPKKTIQDGVLDNLLDRVEELMPHTRVNNTRVHGSPRAETISKLTSEEHATVSIYVCEECGYELKDEILQLIEDLWGFSDAKHIKFSYDSDDCEIVIGREEDRPAAVFMYVKQQIDDLIEDYDLDSHSLRVLASHLALRAKDL